MEWLQVEGWTWLKDVCFSNSSNLTWRDVQYLFVYTSVSEHLQSHKDVWRTNGAGLNYSHQFGFGVADAEAMVTRSRHWINVPEQKMDTIQPQQSSGWVHFLFGNLCVCYSLWTLKFINSLALCSSVTLCKFPTLTRWYLFIIPCVLFHNDSSTQHTLPR